MEQRKKGKRQTAQASIEAAFFPYSIFPFFENVKELLNQKSMP
jgi:hypothetical protein